MTARGKPRARDLIQPPTVRPLPRARAARRRRGLKDPSHPPRANIGGLIFLGSYVREWGRWRRWDLRDMGALLRWHSAGFRARMETLTWKRDPFLAALTARGRQ